MARNEEKQLARLNRFYLQQQKEEELKKRPPRPRLDTLNTARELKKWLPTINRDIDFYIKQMEVPCYPQSKLDEFNEKIRRLKGEYRAFLQKLRILEPDLEVTPWIDRPYSSRKRHILDTSGGSEQDSDNEQPQEKSKSTVAEKFVPLSTPVLQHLATSLPTQYGFEQPAPVLWNVNPDTQDQPLVFDSQKPLAVTDANDTVEKNCHNLDAQEPCVTESRMKECGCGETDKSKSASCTSDSPADSCQISVEAGVTNRTHDTSQTIQKCCKHSSASENVELSDCDEDKEKRNAAHDISVCLSLIDADCKTLCTCAVRKRDVSSSSPSSKKDRSKSHLTNGSTVSSSTNPLNLDYSDSSDSD